MEQTGTAETSAAPSTENADQRRAVIYVRTGSNSPEESADWQLEALERYARDRQFRVVARLADRSSGVARTRPGLDALRRALAEGVADALLVQDLDRLSRKTSLTLELVDEIHGHGVAIHLAASATELGAHDPTNALFNAPTAADALARWRLERGCR